MSRVVCIGDIHLQAGHRRNPERLESLDRIIREGCALEQLGGWILLGDVFHTRSSIADRNDIAPRVQTMADRGPVAVIAGNHDLPGDLEILARLRARFPIVVLDRPQVVTLALASGEPLALFGLPYPQKGGLVAAGADVQQVRDTAAPLLDAIFLDAAAQLSAAAAAGALTMMAGHATIGGARSSVGQPMGLERDIAIDAGLLARLGDIPKIFGHIHAPQELHGAIYAGSIARNDFGECEDKSWILVEFDGAKNFDIHVVPLPVTPLFHVEGELARGGFTWRVTRGPDGEALAAPASWKGCEVRVRYRFNADEKSALDQAIVLAEFAEAKRVELDPIAVRNRAIRSTEVATAATLDEKVAAFVRQSAGVWTPSLGQKLEALQDIDGAAFLNRVQAQIAGDQPVSLDSEEMEEIAL